MKDGHLSPHNQELNERLNELERNPFVDPVAADHTDRYEQPNEVNGHVPDIVAEGPFGGRSLIEVEKRGDDSKHTRNQHQAFEQAANNDPMTGFGVEFVDDQDDDRGLFSFL